MPHTIHNYSQLKEDVQRWAARGDTEFLAGLPEMIHMAEERIFYGGDAPLFSPPVRVPDMEDRVSVDVVDGIGALPDDYLETQAVSWDADFGPALTFKAPNEFNNLHFIGDLPQIYSIQTSQLLLLPIGTGTVTLTYFKRYPELVNDTDSNWILSHAPSIYLKASLIEAFGFGRNLTSQKNSLTDYITAVGGLTQFTRAYNQGAVLSPTIPGTEVVC